MFQSYFYLSSTFLACSLLGTASPLIDPTLRVHETTHVPNGWYHSETHASAPLHLSVALRHSHEAYLDVAREVSDPSSSQYGRYLTADELDALRPDLTISRAAVTKWLLSHGIDGMLEDDSISFETTVDKARHMLAADFAQYYRPSSSPDPVLRTKAYSVPEHLQEHIDFIYPTVHFMDFGRKPVSPSDLRRRQLPPANPNCTNSVCPKLVQSLYQINYQAPDAKSGSKIGVAGFLGQNAHYTDLQVFLKQFGLAGEKLPFAFDVQTLHGGKDNQSESSVSDEADLDIQYISVFSDPLATTFYSVGGRPPMLAQPGNKPVPMRKSINEPYLAFFNYLAKQKSPPQVISISYSDDEETVPLAFANRVCNAIGKLVARGITVVGASGDGGSAGTGTSDECVRPDGKTHQFTPTFPSSCPWLTSVGATRGFVPKDYASDFSSGGFSNYFGTPSWQKAAVTGYQKQLRGSITKYYNASGRGFPDVSVVGERVIIISGGSPGQTSGTSASTPIFAAIVALLNDIRLRAGKPALGHLNPLLYSANASAAFTDVTQGVAGGCSYGKTSQNGFPARKGWDAVSGLGTPIFPKLRAALT